MFFFYRSTNHSEATISQIVLQVFRFLFLSVLSVNLQSCKTSKLVKVEVTTNTLVSRNCFDKSSLLA